MIYNQNIIVKITSKVKEYYQILIHYAHLYDIL